MSVDYATLDTGSWRERIAQHFPVDESLVIPVLQFVHEAAGYLPEPAMRATAQHLRVSESRVYGVASFYQRFHLEPQGANIITVCRGTACHVRGSGSVLRELEKELGVAAGGTTEDLQFTLRTVACSGSCALAPVMIGNGRVYGRQTGPSARALVEAMRAAVPAATAAAGAPVVPAADTAAPALEELPGAATPRAPGTAAPAAGPGHLERMIERAKADWRRLHEGDGPVISVGMASCGMAAGAGEVREALDEELGNLGLTAHILEVGCIGLCFAEPLVDVELAGLPRVTYRQVSAESIGPILEAHLMRKEPAERYALGTSGDGAIMGIADLSESPMVRRQVRVASQRCGRIDPTNVDHYLALDGYAGLRRALSTAPDEVIAEIESAGLRGRGGAGFPTATKWRVCRAASGDTKYVICNANEGDPGAFMDRSLLEGDPHALVEGMAIAAYAVGAAEGYVYIASEFPLAIERVEGAIVQARASGLLGPDILGSGLAFDLQVKRGAGAFVCGEETALIASIEGRRGMPRPRPPYPAEQGLFGRPSVVNNVETFATVPSILREGAEWFAGLGTETSKGTKILALTGKIKRAGLFEAPMGITLAEVVDDLGGGISGGGRFKAAQTGGPSGGCLPASLLDLPIDFERLEEAGSMMGSGGLVVMDETSCMVDLARYFLTFSQNESCGQCTPCREGTGRMLEILERICAGEGQTDDLPLLERLGRSIQATSLCALGRTAPNPVLTSLEYFRDEYLEHIEQKHCRAGLCAGLVKAPCTHLCPVGVEAHRYVRSVSQGKFEEAYLVVREKLPMPSICGVVCFHPCERSCRRGGLDESIAVRAIKDAAVRFGGHAEERIPAATGPTSGKSVAIIGSGPAGLTAAYYLAKRGGHAVTVFEALRKPGGMLRYGIPRYRLPEEVLEHDLDIIASSGVEIRTDSKVHSLAALRGQGFDAIFISSGAHTSYPLGVEGDDAEGVVDCVQFLRDVASGHEVSVGRRVAVVGGGNSAIDASRTALRIGAGEVTILYRRDRDDMPADDQEIADALAEGVRLETLTVPVKVETGKDGLLLTCQRVRLGEVDESGRRRPVAIEGSEFTSRYDTVLSAVGQHPSVPADWGLAVGSGERIRVDPRSLQTSVEDVFAGGDAVLGPASVIESIAHGRAAAQAIDRYLGGSGDIDEHLAPLEVIGDLPPLPVETGDRFRPSMPSSDVETRIHTFSEVELGYSRHDAIEEAGRCLRCDLREQLL